MAKKYKDIKIPIELANDIDKLVSEGYFGYRNRGEFAIDAIRRRLEDIEESRKGRNETRKKR